jgi:hypothetical protein
MHITTSKHNTLGLCNKELPIVKCLKTDNRKVHTTWEREQHIIHAVVRNPKQLQCLMLDAFEHNRPLIVLNLPKCYIWLDITKIS